MSTYHLNRTRTAAVTAAALVCVAGVVGPATTADARGVRATARSGACSTLGTWSTKAAAEAPGMIAFEFSVDTGRAAQRFQVRLLHNGTRVATVVRATHAPSGSFTVRKLVPNAAGTDHFHGVATRVGAANTCSGRVRF